MDTYLLVKSSVVEEYMIVLVVVLESLFEGSQRLWSTSMKLARCVRKG